MNYQLYYGCFVASFLGSILSGYKLFSQIIALMLLLSTLLVGIFLEKNLNFVEKYLDQEKYKNIFKKIYSGIQRSLKGEDDNRQDESNKEEKIDANISTVNKKDE